MLIGIVVSNTVILTDYANQKLQEGHTPLMAIHEAGVTRFRPILMTAVSAMMALFPIVAEWRQRTVGPSSDRGADYLNLLELGFPSGALYFGSEKEHS